VKDFPQLYAALDATTSTAAKTTALVDYFRTAPPADAAWAVFFLSGEKPKQAVPTAKLRALACAVAGVEDWLFEECYQAVGDLAETIAHLLPPPTQTGSDAPLAQWVEERLLPLRGLPEPEVDARLRAAWAKLDATGRFVWNKLITGGFRVGVSKLLVTRAVAQVAGLPTEAIAERLMGTWTPTAARWLELIGPDDIDEEYVGEGDAGPGDAGAGDSSGGAEVADGGATQRAPSRTRSRTASRGGRPYPFFLAQPLDQRAPASLGPVADWQIEWKWDGIRAQVIRRGDDVHVWSRGEELVTERFPEVVEAARALPPGTVLDGELLAWRDAAPLPFAVLQQRIGRKALGPKVLRDAPVAFVTYDLLEADGADWRARPLSERRARLEAIVAALDDARLRVSPVVAVDAWDAAATLRAEARARGVEGFMLKRRSAAYGIGRTKQDSLGEWWKWKVDPFSVDAVLVYAQRGHGRRASLYTDYTFAVWRGTELVPFAKAYSGLNDDEFVRVDAFIRKHTVEKFGPVRSVTPALVMEIGFEGIQHSPRHKSGIAVRFPRMLRIRDDKRIEEADTLDALRALIDAAPRDTRSAAESAAAEAISTGEP
jgi:DNA ligase-1